MSICVSHLRAVERDAVQSFSVARALRTRADGVYDGSRVLAVDTLDVLSYKVNLTHVTLFMAR